MAMNDTTTGIWLTEEGFKTLQHELEMLTTIKRPEIADRIRASQEHGEFSEDNHELDEVKFEQAIVEGRIGELKTIFGTAQVLELDMIPTDHVGMGTLVTLEDCDFGDEFTVRMVTSMEADPNKDLVSNESPLGESLYGASVGDVVTVQAPDGIRKYKVKGLTK